MSYNEKEQGLVDGTVWVAFCDSLKRVGQQVLRPQTPADPFNRAEGFRYLTRLLRLSLEKNIEFNDPCFPQFYSLSHETAKIGNDNPDNFYQNCAISGRYDYRIIGHRGTVPYLSIETKAGSYGSTGAMAPTGHIALDDMAVAEDGSFEIIVSTRPHAGNWLPMTVESDNMLVRNTFLDRSNEKAATLHIECLNADRDSILQPGQFVDQLSSVPQFMEATANMFVHWMDIFATHKNHLPANDQQMCLAAGGDVNIHYHNSYWQLADDEALIIEAKTIPECRTWNMQISNYWLESLDFRYHKISVNKHTASYNDDGSVTMVLAHQNPGEKYPNWLETAGHNLGSMLFRWVEARDHPPLKTRVVKFDAL